MAVAASSCSHLLSVALRRSKVLPATCLQPLYRCQSLRSATTSSGLPSVAVDPEQAQLLRDSLNQLVEIAPTPSTSSSSSSSARASSRSRRRRRGAATATTDDDSIAATSMAVSTVNSGNQVSAKLSADGISQPRSLSSDSALVPLDPTEGMLQQQLSAWRGRLESDMKLKVQSESKEMATLVHRALHPKREKAVVDELPPPVVQQIFDDLIVDPEKELIEIREVQVAESLALHLEQLFSCSPPRGLLDALGCDKHYTGPAPVKVEQVIPPESNDLPYLVALSPRYPGENGTSADEQKWMLSLQSGLQNASSGIAAALSRRFLLGSAPKLLFFVYSSENGLQVTSGSALTKRAAIGSRNRALRLWRVAAKVRRRTVHAAMSSFSTRMTWA